MLQKKQIGVKANLNGKTNNKIEEQTVLHPKSVWKKSSNKLKKDLRMQMTHAKS